MIELDLDNETLATTHDAIVLSVGGVLSENGVVLEKIHFRVNIDEQLALGRKFSTETFKWWMAQSDDARKSVISSEVPEIHVATGRAILLDVGYRAETIWARPAMFDLPMLRHLFGQDIWDDQLPRWKNHGYQKERDLGTLLKEFDPYGAYKPRFVGEPHNAYDDAFHHMQWRMALRAMLHERGAYDAKTTGGAVWTCKIGEHDAQFLVDGADAPMRRAVELAYKGVTGREPKFCFSGWDGHLVRSERDVVDSIVPPPGAA